LREIDLSEVLHILLRRVWVIILKMLVAGAAAAVIEKALGAKRSADIFSRCEELLGT